MNKKYFPLKKDQVLITSESDSFKSIDYSKQTEIPVGEHVGAFGTLRKNHRHEGVDLYCNPNDEVVAIEDGVVVLVEDFTGLKTASPWWNDTRAVHVEGSSGVIVYGEIQEIITITIGTLITAGEILGRVVPVLKVNKGRPMAMLHVELYHPGTREPVAWHPWIDEKPKFLKNPTFLLQSTIL
jgi:murein DD-endopeptidase MepM/ murein hydrolase activator NlpD